jgi:Kinetochore complex Fta4 of Sim4 subunit, or CENP-50
MDRVKAITDVKAAFIRSQVRQLSTPLQPSAQWRDFAPETESQLSDKLVQDVIAKGTA